MKFEQAITRSLAPFLSPSERKAADVLVVDSDAVSRQAMRQTLLALGYGAMSDANDHIAGIQKLQQRHFTHVIFEAKRTNMPARDFLVKCLEYSDHLVTIPASTEPTVDDVFGLLVVGARGYIVKPFTEESIDDAMVQATKGEPISDAILYAKDRNEALSSLILTAMDKVATVKRQAIQFETARREVPIAVNMLKRAVSIGRTFAKDGDDALLEAMVEMCLERAGGPATRLGRLRKRLDRKRPGPGEEDSVEEAKNRGT